MVSWLELSFGDEYDLEELGKSKSQSYLPTDN